MTAPTAPLLYVTGASSGIGQALALHAYALGWRLCLVSRRADAVHTWAAQQGLDPARHAILAADVTDTDSIVAAGHTCLQTLGLPDVVAACAGISHGIDTAERADLDVMQRILDTNVMGLAATFHPFVAPMRAAGRGTLVGVASMTGIRGLPGHGAYCASKAAVIAYCESLRGELRAAGVPVVTLVPGYIDTPMTAHDTYARPFLISAAEFARRAWPAIRAGRSYRVIPWQMAVVARLLRLLPNAVFDRLLAGRPRKPRLTPDGQP